MGNHRVRVRVSYITYNRTSQQGNYCSIVAMIDQRIIEQVPRGAMMHLKVAVLHLNAFNTNGILLNHRSCVTARINGRSALQV